MRFDLNISSRVGVVVIGRNEGERLKLCLTSLTNQTNFVVYVDSGSTDNSVASASALGAEVARNSATVRAAFTKTVRTTAELLTQIVSGKSKRAKKERSLAIYSSLVGALVLSRAVDDPELSTEILQATLASISAVDSASRT